MDLETCHYLASIVESAQDAVVGCTPDGRITVCNRAAEELFGHGKQELVGKPAAMLMLPDSWQRVRRMAARVMQDERLPPFEVRVRRHKGEDVEVQVSLSAVRNAEGEITSVAAVVRAITERDGRPQRSEEWFRRAFQHAPFGMCLSAADHRILHANTTFCQMLGWTEEELIGQEWLAFVQPEDREIAIESCRRLRREGAFSIDYENRYIRKDGTAIPARVRISGLDDCNRPADFVTHVEDITEQKRGRDRMENSLREKEALLREIHHRVKNNLQIVCSLLKLNSQALRDPEALHVFEDTRNRVKAMALVHETLYRSGNLGGIDFSEYIPRLTDQLLHTYGLSRGPSSECGSGHVAVLLDVDALVLPIDKAIPCALMLTELISNSAKHALVGTAGGELRITFRLSDQLSWLLQVEDSGSTGAAASEGIPSSFGLELVRLLTEQLDGTMQIERNPGFRVSVRFPLAGAMGEEADQD